MVIKLALCGSGQQFLIVWHGKEAAESAAARTITAVPDRLAIVLAVLFHCRAAHRRHPGIVGREAGGAYFGEMFGLQVGIVGCAVIAGRGEEGYAILCRLLLVKTIPLCSSCCPC